MSSPIAFWRISPIASGQRTGQEVHVLERLRRGRRLRSRLEPADDPAADTLKEWVGDHSGGVIFVAGPVFSYQLARPGGRDFSGLLSIYPVVLQDNRLHNINIGKLGHDSTRPYALELHAIHTAGQAFRFPQARRRGGRPRGRLEQVLLEQREIPARAGRTAARRASTPTILWNGSSPTPRSPRLSPAPRKAHQRRQGRAAVHRLDAVRLRQNALPRFRRILAAAPPWKAFTNGCGSKWRVTVSAGATQRKKYGSILMSRHAAGGRRQLRGRGQGEGPVAARAPICARPFWYGASIKGRTKRRRCKNSICSPSRPTAPGRAISPAKST